MANETDKDDTSSLAESTVRYTDRASEAEAKVGALEERVRAMETSMEMQRQQDINTAFFVQMKQQQQPEHIVIPGQGPIQGPFFDPYGR